MRRVPPRLAVAAACSLLAAPASAQPASIDALGAGATEVARDEQPQPLGHGAMPGGLHAPSAETLPKGVGAVAAFGGFGWRSGLLAGDHRFGRGIGGLAFAFAPVDVLTIGLAFDGRYDRHYGVAPAGEDGYVGDPRLFLRVAKGLGTVKLGGQVGVWVPGKDAPSVAASAISVDARALASLQAGPGVVSFSGGFRLDNSAKSVEMRENLSLADRVSLGVSDYHAVVGSAHATFPAGKAFLGGEASIDLFIGSGAPGPVLRAGVHGGVHLSPQWALIAFAELAKVPAIDPADVAANSLAQIAYEPMITGGLGLEARFGGTKPKGDGKGGAGEGGPRPPIEVIEYAELAGTVTDDSGKPVVGAKVTVKLERATVTAVTDDKGRWNVPVGKLPIGKTVNGVTTLDDTGAEVSVAVDGKKPAVATLTLVKGPNAVAKLTLEPLVRPGLLKAVVRAAATGKPIANATLRLAGTDITATTDAEGKLELELPPGTYSATVTADKYKAQTLQAIVDPDGVALKNFELPK